ncbi:MAG: hypothetical protein IPI44_16545 [Sulfuritalea sp.]|nr:hypothetical protein [Sulfuritalea sp.]
MSEATAVPERAKQDGRNPTETGDGSKPRSGRERMLAALANGVKNKWFSVIDKVARTDTLHLAGRKLREPGCGGS